MTCERSEQLLALREEGALSPRLARRVTEHLDGCGRCRALQLELGRGRRWIESAPPPPLAEDDFETVRRGVWREIEARRLESRRSVSLSRALAFAGASFAAAVLGAIWLARQSPKPALARLSPPTTAPRTASLPAPTPSSALSSRPAPPAVASVSRPPATRVARAARRRSAPGDTGFSRIEFRTANPNVRVIWLVKKGREESSVRAGRKEEVS